MISISLSNLTLILGAKTLFRELSWEIQHDQKIGLVGPNGTGKSSLFKLITQEYTAEQGGTITRAKGVTIGYLPLQPEFDTSAAAFQLALDGNPCVAALEQELAGIESRLGDPSVYNDEKALTQALELHEKTLFEYEALGDFVGTVLVISHDRYFLDSTVERILALEGGWVKEYIRGYSDYEEKKGCRE
jgi:ATP-binding cassette subfamily F protein 3